MMNESKGALTEAVYYILISLYTPLHGYGVIQNVEKLSGGRVRLGAGTLYGALNSMVDKIIDDQVNSGYFAQCPISFLEIADAKDVFKTKLRTIYHTRIQYPELSEDKRER